jgi:hypothetical protein
MFSDNPISSTPISSTVSADYVGLELFVFTFKINKVIEFTLKLSY